MPPASLLTLLVMNPGPITAKSHRELGPQRRQPPAERHRLSLPDHPAEDVLDVDQADQIAEFIDHGQRAQVVLLETLDDFVERSRPASPRGLRRRITPITG